MESTAKSHQLSNGLFVSGPPKQPKERLPTMSSAPVPYTGGDVTTPGELGRMFDLPVDRSKSRNFGLSEAPTRLSSFGRSASQSGPLNKHGEPIKKSYGSGRVSRQNSVARPSVLPATGLITSGPLNSLEAPRISGPLDISRSANMQGSTRNNNQGVTTLGEDGEHLATMRIRMIYIFATIVLFLLGFMAGVYMFEALHSFILVIAIFIMFCIVGGLFVWNLCRGRKAADGFVETYPCSELRNAKNGEFVKVSGVVTCGNVSLASSFEKVLDCVYTSTSLYEYRTWASKAANPTHRCFTWGLRATEKHVVDFYISDSQSGLRALVKSGNGARVTPYVDEKVVLDVNPGNIDSNPDFVQWLGARNLSLDDRVMRLKEGYIKEGSRVTVMGVVRRNENELMIVPPPKPISTGCQWTKCIFPARFKGLVLSSDNSPSADFIV